jgi:hypothetical protein
MLANFSWTLPPVSGSSMDETARHPRDLGRGPGLVPLASARGYQHTKFPPYTGGNAGQFSGWGLVKYSPPLTGSLRRFREGGFRPPLGFPLREGKCWPNFWRTLSGPVGSLNL